MCGIAGILTTRPDLDLAIPLGRMRDALRHRGPDDDGVEEVNLPGGFRLGLAQTRLAILDLSPAGHQPMHDAESGSWVVYNGESYNHQELRRARPDLRFRSTGDTETLLKAWAQDGPRVLGLLRGMFAFALYDGRRRQLWLARDRLGVKPLYGSRVGPETWVFGSEVRALLASGLVSRRLNGPAVESYLAYGAVAAPWTFVDGVESLLPGECWRFDLESEGRPLVPRRQVYWRPDFARPGSPTVSRAEAVERLRPVLREAAALRMVSDVPVGVFLSGGIDSSALVALLSHAGHTLHTFSIAFSDRRWDESDHSRRVAETFGTRHTELLLRPADILPDFPQAVAAYDQPSIDGLNTYYIARVTRQAGVKVALSGLGGDELFAGYPYFRLMARLERRLTRGLARGVHAGLRWLAPRSTRTTKLGQLLAAGRSRLAGYLACRLVMPRPRRLALLAQPALTEEPLPPEVPEQLGAAAEGLDPVNAQSLLELSLYLANMLLRDTDQMSMAHALEVREPLLDHVLVETAAALPGPLKTAAGTQGRVKGLLVDALPAPLPASVVNRPKWGFILPWERWLRQELRPYFDELFAAGAAVQAAGLRRAAVTDLWDGFLANRPGLRASDVLAVANLVSWVRQHELTPPRDHVERIGIHAQAAGRRDTILN